MDLHGNAKKKETTPDGNKDENVFDIKQGVAIGLFVKHANERKSRSASVYHYGLFGERQGGVDGGKYGWLVQNDVASTQWTELSPKSPQYLFVPRDDALLDEYERGWELKTIFPVNSVGVVTARDKIAIRWTSEEMQSFATEFVEYSAEDARSVWSLPKDSSDWKIHLAQQDIMDHADFDRCVVPIQYRPFDRRFLNVIPDRTNQEFANANSENQACGHAIRVLSIVFRSAENIESSLFHVFCRQSRVSERVTRTAGARMPRDLANWLKKGDLG